MDRFPRYVTPPQKFGYHSVNPAKGGKSFNLMYCVYGKIFTVYYSSTCSSAFVPTTYERLTQLIVRRVCILLPFVALPYDFSWLSYALTKLTGSFQNYLPPSPRRFSISTKVLPLLFEPGECTQMKHGLIHSLKRCARLVNYFKALLEGILMLL